MLMKRNCGLLPVLAATLLIGAVSAQAETVTVVIDKMAFSPAEIAIKAGDTVQWVNKDILAHTATVKGGWDVMIPAKQTAATTIAAAGEFDYICRFHPNMKGRIVVSPP